MPTPFLICWDFNGVLDTYGQHVEKVLQTIIDKGGQNIVVTSAPSQPVSDYLEQRQLRHHFHHIYGMDKHHGQVVRHKVAAISGHIQDEGPFCYALIIGDNLSDIHDGQEAGITTCLFDQHHYYQPTDHQADYVVDNLIEVLDLLPLAARGNSKF